MILGGFAYIAGAAVSGASVNVSMAILSGALLSVGLGFTTQRWRDTGEHSAMASSSACVSELSPPRLLTSPWRRSGEARDGGSHWRWLASLPCSSPSAPFFCRRRRTASSSQGQDRDKVKALLQKIRGVDTVDDELDEIIAANAAAAQGENGLWLIL
ncbi:hypothetical protein OsJ_18452 [Oryza sativa Japonica Group]|uniref:Uncharacterized protein n=1 Tax=Oryza sativa subsp. japonica TaxID=39947 RepID=B9FIB6_ORYSJ|nr:hypothetical protein OsJ_18452 [Oryza sativa Japonica Group]